jgi:hypothetical protein
VLKRLEKEMVSGIAELRLQRDVGTFVIDSLAVAVLDNLMRGLDESVAIYESSSILAHYYQHKIKVVTECQTQLDKIARDDLKKVWGR